MRIAMHPAVCKIQDLVNLKLNFLLLVFIFHNAETPGYGGTICEAAGKSEDRGCPFKQLL
jgi:hypothetical protein